MEGKTIYLFSLTFGRT